MLAVLVGILTFIFLLAGISPLLITDDIQDLGLVEK